MGPFERGIKEINIPLKYIVEVHLLKKKSISHSLKTTSFFIVILKWNIRAWINTFLFTCDLHIKWYLSLTSSLNFFYLCAIFNHPPRVGELKKKIHVWWMKNALDSPLKWLSMNIIQDWNIVNGLWKQGYIIPGSFVHVNACYTLLIVCHKYVQTFKPLTEGESPILWVSFIA